MSVLPSNPAILRSEGTLRLSAAVHDPPHHQQGAEAAAPVSAAPLLSRTITTQYAFVGCLPNFVQEGAAHDAELDGPGGGEKPAPDYPAARAAHDPAGTI